MFRRPPLFFQVLFPLPGIAAEQAGLDIAPVPGDIRKWIPEQSKVLGAGLIALHTWPSLMAFMGRLLRASKRPLIGIGGSGPARSGSDLIASSRSGFVTSTTSSAGQPSLGAGHTLTLRPSPHQPDILPTASSIGVVDLPSLASKAANPAALSRRAMQADAAESWKLMEEHRVSLWIGGYVSIGVEGGYGSSALKQSSSPTLGTGSTPASIPTSGASGYLERLFNI